MKCLIKNKCKIIFLAELVYTLLSILLKIDEVVERMLTLGSAPDHRFTSYKKLADIKESNQVEDGKKAIANILDSFGTIIKLQRDILSLSGEIGDEGTNALMSDYIRAQEKMVWMYSAYLNK